MKKLSSYFTIIGALAVSAVIIIMTLWVSSAARNTTDQAVEELSYFYLNELAGRRSQSVSGIIDSRIEQMQRAVNALTKEALSSQDSLRSFIGTVKNLYNLDLLAFVDDQDIVYTEYATYMGKSRYDFLSNMPSDGSVISTMSMYTGKKEICIAIPVKDHVFMGSRLKACFVEIDITDFADTLSFHSEENGSYFGLYHRNGENLTDQDFGPVESSMNLLTAMEEAMPADQMASMKNDFSEGRTGGQQFSDPEGDYMLYYTAIPETNWMLCVQIPKNLIYDQISGINDETLYRGKIQLLVICAALLVYFGILFMISHRHSRVMLEQEKQNTKEISKKAQQSEAELGIIRKIASKDSLTGVNNKYAYMKEEKRINEAIKAGQIQHLAVMTCDLNGLKHINDIYGHLAGDEYIRQASSMICNLYKHSAVYRIGGDEFTIIMFSQDYTNRHELLATLNSMVEENINNGKVVLSAGMAEYQNGDATFADVFRRADREMYRRKKELKAMGSTYRE